MFWGAFSLSPSHESSPLPIQQDLDDPIGPWFVVGEAANLPGGDNALFTKPSIVSDTWGKAVNVFSEVLLKHLQGCYPVAAHQAPVCLR